MQPLIEPHVVLRSTRRITDPPPPAGKVEIKLAIYVEADLDGRVTFRPQAMTFGSALFLGLVLPRDLQEFATWAEEDPLGYLGRVTTAWRVIGYDSFCFADQFARN